MTLRCSQVTRGKQTPKPIKVDPLWYHEVNNLSLLGLAFPLPSINTSKFHLKSEDMAEESMT